MFIVINVNILILTCKYFGSEYSVPPVYEEVWTLIFRPLRISVDKSGCPVRFSKLVSAALQIQKQSWQSDLCLEAQRFADTYIFGYLLGELPALV